MTFSIIKASNIFKNVYFDYFGKSESGELLNSKSMLCLNKNILAKNCQNFFTSEYST